MIEAARRGVVLVEKEHGSRSLGTRVYAVVLSPGSFVSQGGISG